MSDGSHSRKRKDILIEAMKQPYVQNTKQARSLEKNVPSKIYIIKDDGKYYVWEYESNINQNKEEEQCR